MVGGVLTHFFCLCGLGGFLMRVVGFGCVVGYWGVMGLFCLRLLQDLWAAANGDAGSDGIRWSAVQLSLGRAPCPHIQQCVAVSLTIFALRL